MKKITLIFLILFAPSTVLVAQNCEKKIEQARYYLTGNTPFKNYTKAFNLLTPCANNGNVEAQNYLGMMYLNGIGVEKDEIEAFNYFITAAQNNYDVAQYNLGRMYKYGMGCDLSFIKAIEWFETAAENGNQKAAYSLGYMYYKGFGVAQNYQEAVSWFEKSSDVMAKHFLGMCYYLGYGVATDEDKALEILLSNPTVNSKTLVSYIEQEQKQKVSSEVQNDLNSTDPESNLIQEEVVLETPNELEYYPLEPLELNEMEGVWKGKLVQYDWSGKHMRRIIPISLAIETESDSNNIFVNSQIENQEITSTAIWQDETLYFEDITQTVTLNRLFPEHPDELTLDYNLYSTSLQKYEYQGITYLIGSLDSYIPKWKEYGKPMRLILKPEGAGDIDEEILLALAEQENQFIKLYPVPFNNQLTVQYQLETADTVFVELVSLYGTQQIVILPTIFQEAGEYTYNIPVDSTLQEGLYVVRIIAGNQVHTRMIIKNE